MVQYDQFSQMFGGGLPTREKATESHPDIVRSPSQTEMAGALHPRLRRLSQSHSPPQHYCAKCHMRRSSQNLVLTRSHSHLSSDDEESESFCPDICMPTEVPRPRVHTRRHSGLCPGNLVSQEHNGGRTSPTQMTLKQSAQHNSGSNTKCHCETILPSDNLDERYGLVEEPEEIKPQRQSLDHQAADQMAQIMREELIADLRARQPML
ncbi:uncharacterized protein PV06_10028 [Exophiala oligosperma]|uniref:Uncharacterized protein n=2 Tax=Chaetothyriales TaxID=34395 RepID=A0A0D2BL39_9EURO|nr:uncharacterized protein PV06_10028 [Exophiala oligosperma]KAJ9639311.1 hypothetical protein H2204_003922 [Knufia peltigerae]KIW38057.1 hypothetical protein PV06_10028 [Exophiala oligosperma]